MLLYVNSCSNPIIYVMRSSDYRQSAINMDLQNYSTKLWSLRATRRIKIIKNLAISQQNINGSVCAISGHKRTSPIHNWTTRNRITQLTRGCRGNPLMRLQNWVPIWKYRYRVLTTREKAVKILSCFTAISENHIYHVISRILKPRYAEKK